jgi:aminoglycoside phosphotransferase
VATTANLVDLEWTRLRLKERFGEASDVLDVSLVPSRLATVHRLLVKAGDTKRWCYLKHHTETSLATGFAEYAANLSTVAQAFGDEAGLLPYDVIAIDGSQGVQLVGQTPGRSMGDLHREWLLSRAGRAAGVAAWGRVGRWLAALHWKNRPPVPSTTRADELVAYIDERLERWAALDPAQQDLTSQIASALRTMTRSLQGRPVTVTLCHGDVSTGNIMVDGAAVGLIDLDDARIDMPALDLSQAIWEIGEYWRLGAVVPVPGCEAKAIAAFKAGYGASFPAGPEFLLPHVRNLVVIGLTVASRRSGLGPGRVVEELRYRRALAELRRALSAIRTS